MSVMRGSSTLAYLLLMLKVIVHDMTPFVIVMVSFLITFGFSFYILTSDEHNGYRDGAETFFSTYLTPMLGAFNRIEYEQRMSHVLLFMYFTLFANLIMLNMLIAIMGESYGKVRENMGDRILLERAALILEEQDFIVYGDYLWEAVENWLGRRGNLFKTWITVRQNERKRLRDVEYPSWLHCLVKRKYANDPEFGTGAQDTERSSKSATSYLELLQEMQQRMPSKRAEQLRVKKEQKKKDMYPGSIDVKVGDACEVLEQMSNPKWLRVRMSDGTTGVVARSKLEPMPVLPDPSDDEETTAEPAAPPAAAGST